MMIRGITLILANYALCRWFNSPTDFKDPTIFRVHVFRGSLMVVFSILFASSQYILPLPIIHTLNCSGTLFIFLIDYQLNKVKINSKQSIGIFIGFIGALIATNSKILTKIIDP
jgi:drug/metabolite transporter (DMT)-like permease